MLIVVIPVTYTDIIKRITMRCTACYMRIAFHHRYDIKKQCNDLP